MREVDNSVNYCSDVSGSRCDIEGTIRMVLRARRVYGRMNVFSYRMDVTDERKIL